MGIWVQLWYLFQALIGYNLILPLILLACYTVLKKKKTPALEVKPDPADYAIVVTAYQYTDSLASVVASLLKLNYEKYLIYIVADNCKVDDLSFSDERVVVLQPERILANNTRSHFYAIERFERNHERIAIIDSDNLVDPEFLNEMNVYFDQGFQAVQGLRKPRNLDTTLACLDAARDIYYHFYDGKVLSGLGSSATLSGSGMAFTVTLFWECMGQLTVDGAGFDKVLQAQIVKRDLRIAFAEKAVVYDAKTSHSNQLISQRSRWIGSWFVFCSYSIQLLVRGGRNLSINQLLFGLILLRPPLFIFLLLSVLCWSVNLFLNPVGQWLWMSALSLFITGFGIALLRSHTERRIYQAFLHVPKFIFLQLIALVRFLLKIESPVSTRHSFNLDHEK